MSSSPFVFYKNHLASGRPPQKQTDAMAYGSAFHKLILEPEEFQKSYTVLEGRKGTKAWDEAAKKLVGKIILKKSQADDLQAMQESLDRPITKILFADGIAEESVYWEYKGTPFKSRFDFRNEKEKLIIDLKTTVSSGPGFPKEVLKHRLHWQAFLYAKCAEATFGSPYTFVFAAIEKVYPYSVGFYTLDQRSLSQGEEEIDETIERYNSCVKNDAWPDHNNDQITEISIPFFRKKA